jgi:hypothetical protein
MAQQDIVFGVLSIKNCKTLMSEDGTGVVYVYRRTRLTGEALEEPL